MQFVRTFDESVATATGFPGYNWQLVSRLESAYVIGSWIDAGGCGPGLHYHEVDQAYYLVRGTSHVSAQRAPNIAVLRRGLRVRRSRNSTASSSFN